MKTVNNIMDLTKDNFRKAVVVFSQESFSREYSDESRSYEFTNEEKFFDADAIGSSLHGTCLDSSEIIRLDLYMFEPDNSGRQWKVEKIYITEE